MAFFEFPNTRNYDSDLGWLIRNVVALREALSAFTITNTVKYADPISWNIAKQYESNTIVIDDTAAYISRKPVPAGIPLTDENYWTKLIELQELSAVPYRYAVNVTDLGVDNSGETDVTYALNSLDYEGRVLYLPEGTYLISDSINWKNCRVIGNNAIIKFRKEGETEKVHTPCFLLENSDYFELSGVKLDSVGFGFKGISSYNTYIHDVETLCNYYAIYFGGTPERKMSGVYIERVHITENVTNTLVANNYDGIHVDGYTEYVYISDVHGWTGDDFLAFNASENVVDTIYNAGTIEHIYVNNVCTTENYVSHSGVRIHGTAGNTLKDLNFSNCLFAGSSGRVIRFTNADGTVTDPSHPNIIIDNVKFTDCNIQVGDSEGTTVTSSALLQAVWLGGATIDNAVFDNIGVDVTYDYDSTVIPAVIFAMDGFSANELTLSKIHSSTADSLLRGNYGNRNINIKHITIDSCILDRNDKPTRLWTTIEALTALTIGTLQVINSVLYNVSRALNVPETCTIDAVIFTGNEIRCTSFINFAGSPTVSFFIANNYGYGGVLGLSGPSDYSNIRCSGNMPINALLTRGVAGDWYIRNNNGVFTPYYYNGSSYVSV